MAEPIITPIDNALVDRDRRRATGSMEEWMASVSDRLNEADATETGLVMLGRLPGDGDPNPRMTVQGGEPGDLSTIGDFIAIGRTP